MRLQVLTQKYTCGGCTVCCHVMSIAELGKPFYVNCEHRMDTGCGIYAARPTGCREYLCAYVAGFLGEGDAWRPDHSGLLFFLRRYADGLWLEIFEAAAGASLELNRLDYLTQRIVNRIAKQERVVGTHLHRYGDKVGLAFVADERKFPGADAVSGKMNRYHWINRDPSEQVFKECHDPE